MQGHAVTVDDLYVGAEFDCCSHVSSPMPAYAARAVTYVSALLRRPRPLQPRLQRAPERLAHAWQVWGGS